MQKSINAKVNSPNKKPRIEAGVAFAAMKSCTAKPACQQCVCVEEDENGRRAGSAEVRFTLFFSGSMHANSRSVDTGWFPRNIWQTYAGGNAL